MTNITDLMTHDHRECDELFARVEGLAGKKKWDEARTTMRALRAAIEAHFDAEEQTLFPRFEAATGMTGGPTQVMRGEHVEMRNGLAAMEQALADEDRDEFAGEAETLLILMQQHNMKEENILYPMCDSHLAGEVGTLTTALAERIKGVTA